MAKQFAEIDQNVNIPAAVKAASALADQVFKQAYDQEGSEEGASDGEDAGEQKPAEAASKPTAEQTFTSTDETPPARKAAKSKEDDEQSWEHRYKSMKGRYDRAETQIKAMSDQITHLQNTITSIQAAQYNANETDTYSERFITPEEEQDYGSEFLAVVGRKAKEELVPEVASLKKEIANLRAQLAGVGGYVQQDARSRLETSLGNSVANWKEINMKPEFLSWLKLPDAYSGVIRHELLRAAYERNDAPRVVAFFKGFLAEEAATAPVEGRPDLDGGSTASRKVSLETLAAPGRAKTAAASGAPAEKPNFTRAQIAKFYADSAAGKYRGKEAEKDRIEMQIFDAEREGRIR